MAQKEQKPRQTQIKERALNLQKMFHLGEKNRQMIQKKAALGIKNGLMNNFAKKIVGAPNKSPRVWFTELLGFLVLKRP